MSKKALLVIDYTYDFVADDGKLTCGKPGQAIEGAICEEIAKAVAAGEDIFVLNDYHLENDPAHPESKLFPPHNVAGTPGRELYGEVRRAVDEAEKSGKVHRLDKTRYSRLCAYPPQRHAAGAGCGYRCPDRRVHGHLYPAHGGERIQRGLLHRGAPSGSGLLQSGRA